MKKFIAIIAAIALIATMSVAAFAATETTKMCEEVYTTDGAVAGLHYDKLADDQTNDVYVTLTGDITHVVCVEVTWDNMHFEYDGAMVWNPHEAYYEVAAGGAWTSTDNTITFKNLSDVKVEITPTYTKVDEFNVSDAHFEQDGAPVTSIDIEKVGQAADGTVTPAANETITFVIDDTNTPTMVGEGLDVIVGNITLEVAAV